MIRKLGFTQLLTALATRLAASSLTSGYTVYNKVPRTRDAPTFPYVTIGTPICVPDVRSSARDLEGEDISVGLNVWSSANSDKECADMMDNIIRAIAGSDLAVSGYDYIIASLDMAEIIIDDTEPTRLVRHGVIRYRFHIIPTS